MALWDRRQATAWHLLVPLVRVAQCRFTRVASYATVASGCGLNVFACGSARVTATAPWRLAVRSSANIDQWRAPCDGSCAAAEPRISWASRSPARPTPARGLDTGWPCACPSTVLSTSPRRTAFPRPYSGREKASLATGCAAPSRRVRSLIRDPACRPRGKVCHRSGR